MGASNKNIKPNPSVLRMLRESSGYSVNDIARKLGTSSEKINDVEADKSSLTLAQIKNLANIYHRPLAAFFSDEPLHLPVIEDYRINRNKKLTPEVFLAKRRAYYLASKIVEISGRRSDIPTFPASLTAEELARDFRNYLNIGLMKSDKPDVIIAHYKSVIEDKLALSIIEYPLKADDVRAFSIYSDVSIIVLNERDKPEIKLFSLLHEICHLLKRTSGICSIEMEVQPHQHIETFCNNFAAEFLVPEDDLKNEVRTFGTEIEGVKSLVNIYGISRQVIMLRLLKLGCINSNRYKQFTDNFDKELVKRREGFRRRNWKKVYFNRAGNFAIQEVGRAYKKGEITFLESTKILNLKSKYIEKFVA